MPARRKSLVYVRRRCGLVPPAGPMCANCAPNYYLRPNAQCQLCPSKSGRLEAQLKAAGPFVLLLLGLFALTVVIIWVLETLAGVDSKSALWSAGGHSMQFCLWFVLSAQFMSSSVSSVSAGLPERVMYAFTLISFFSFDSDYVSFEGCDESSYPFAMQLAVLILGLALMLLQISLAFIKRRVRHAGLTRAILQQTSRPTILKAKHDEICARDDAAVAPLAKAHTESTEDFRSGPSLYLRISAVQGAVFALLNAFYTLMAKTCLRFLHCRTEASGMTVLARSSIRCGTGPAGFVPSPGCSAA
jgi:hypothetical protein